MTAGIPDPGRPTVGRKRPLPVFVVLLACGAAALAQQHVPLPGGPGFHDPRSAVPRLAARSDVIAWEVLGQVKARLRDGKIIVEYPAAVKALDRQKVRVQGYMFPLEASQSQNQFLLSAVPTTCPFCVPSGPEGLLEVRAKAALKYTESPVVLEGRMAVLDGSQGVFYRLIDATQVR